MKRPLLFFILFCCANQAFSQVCAVSTDTAHLDVNNARVILQASGDFFWDRSDGGYFNPGDGNVTTMFAGGIWLGGFDAGGNLKIAAQTYGASGGNSDWWPGPLTLDNGSSEASTCSNFDRLWGVNRSEIEAHITDFASDGDIDGPVPPSILAWPGRDNPSSLAANGFELPIGRSFAPFIDRNGNGQYEPLSGDYPHVNGDQAIWWIFNDEGGGAVHTETFGNAIRAEIHALAYAFAGSNDENLANTTFYDFTIHNRAAESLDSTYVGLWLDTDLGCYMDDYIGCISEEKLAFAYNSDAVDGTSGCSCDGLPTYCEDIPITGIKVLDGPNDITGNDKGFSSFAYSANGGVSSIPSWFQGPTNGIQSYYLMSGSWSDGSPTVYGGNGHIPSSEIPYPYMFDGNPADSTAWSLCSLATPGYDYRMLINSGPFNLQPGGSTSVSYAVMTKFGLQHPCPDVTPLIEMGQAIQDLHDEMTSTHVIEKTNKLLSFYPNPLVSQGKLTTNGQQMESVRLFNSNGQLVRFYNGLKTNELVIERNGLPAGLYYYAALLGNGQLATGKIAIQ